MRQVSVSTRIVLVASLCAATSAHAQGVGFADVDEWSAFRVSFTPSARDKPYPELAFQDLRQEGPWARSIERRLAPSELQLQALLSQSKWVEALAHLKQARPDLNRRDESGLTPLTMAVRAGQMELVREMLRQGADPNQTGAGGMTPLGAAAFSGQDVIVKDLLRGGADIDAAGATSQTPLHLACAAGHASTVSLLLQGGADWRLPNKAGRFALQEAAYFGRINVMQLIIKAGANPLQLDYYRLNAVHAAALGEQPQALAWLRQQDVPIQSVLTELLIAQIDAPIRPVSP
jgi:ankyrin repeat protein